MLDALTFCAKQGGELLKKGFYSDKNLTFKSDVDLVTQYDVAVENLVVELLSKKLPELKIIGEEGSIINPNGRYSAYLDPIDGTTNFVHQIPHTAVSIGIWDNDKPIAGVVYNPILDEMYYAEIGKGAYCNGKKIQVSTTNTITNALVATGFPYTKIQKGADYEWVLKNMAKVLPVTRDIRRFGSAALDLCYLARGIFDVYYEINLKPWDYAAGAIILLEAGGSVSNEHGLNLNMNERVIIASNTALHSAISDLINGD